MFCLPGIHFAFYILSLNGFLTAPGDIAAIATANTLASMNVVVVVVVIFGDIVVTIVCVTTHPMRQGPCAIWWLLIYGLKTGFYPAWC